jgi:uncharacterized membrane protein
MYAALLRSHPLSSRLNNQPNAASCAAARVMLYVAYAQMLCRISYAHIAKPFAQDFAGMR